MAQRVQLRRDTAAAWVAANPVLSEGEYGFETDTGKFKIGDGSTAWAALDYQLGSGGGGGGIPDFAGIAVLGRSEEGVTGSYELLDPDTLENALGYAKVTDADTDKTTLTTVDSALNGHIGEDGDTGNVVHGLRPPTVMQGNILSQRYQLYTGAGVTSPVGGFAAAGKVEIWGIGTGANKGLYYRDEDTTAQRLAPLTEYTPEQGYAQVTSTKTSTNTTAFTNDLISGLSVTVVGRGRPVVVEFFCQAVRHSVANNWVLAGLVVNGVADVYTGIVSPSTTINQTLAPLLRRLVLTDGVSYTFEVGVQTQAATATLTAASTAPMWLAVAER